jgi:hypothetical protein
MPESAKIYYICWLIIIEIVVVYYDLYDIHEKFEYSCDVTNEAHPHPLLACLLCLEGPTFLYSPLFLEKGLITANNPLNFTNHQFLQREAFLKC